MQEGLTGYRPFPFKVLSSPRIDGRSDRLPPFRVLLHLWDHGLLQLAVFLEVFVQWRT